MKNITIHHLGKKITISKDGGILYSKEKGAYVKVCLSFHKDGSIGYISEVKPVGHAYLYCRIIKCDGFTDEYKTTSAGFPWEKQRGDTDEIHPNSGGLSCRLDGTSK